MQNNKTNPVVILLIVIVIGFLIYMVFSKLKSDQIVIDQQLQSPAGQAQTTNNTAESDYQPQNNLVQYTNDQVGISFMYPPAYGEVKEKFLTNQDGSKQFVGSFSSSGLVFGTPTTDELSDAESGQYSFQPVLGTFISNKTNSNGISYRYTQDAYESNKFHVMFKLNGSSYKTLEFYGDINNLNLSVIDSVKIF